MGSWIVKTYKSLKAYTITGKLTSNAWSCRIFRHQNIKFTTKPCLPAELAYLCGHFGKRMHMLCTIYRLNSDYEYT